MPALAAPLTENYRVHPAFRFEQKCWELPLPAFESFNKAYSAVRKMGDMVNGPSFDAIRKDCEDDLRAIFHLLHGQCVDQYEEAFVDELCAQCERTLHEELVWYKKTRPQVKVHLEMRKVRDNAMLLHSDRHYFGQLPDTAVAEIQRVAAHEIDKLRANAAAGKHTREDLSINTGSVIAKIRSVLNREFKAMGVLDTLSAYTGRKMRVVGMALELSVPQATWWHNAIDGLARAPETLYAHFDASVDYPKSIVYLSDVSEKNGPTGTYPSMYEKLGLNPLQEMIGRVVSSVGSSRQSVLHGYYGKQYHQSVNSENFRRHFMRLPEALRFNSHMGWDIMPGSQLESAFASSERKMTGPAGTFVVFDGGRLVHRGGLMQEGERIALQVIFSEPSVVRRIINRIKRVIA